jgi:hypothetical protein
MLVGEPSIGKTALCEQLASYVGARGGLALVGHCHCCPEGSAGARISLSSKRRVARDARAFAEQSSEVLLASDAPRHVDAGRRVPAAYEARAARQASADRW